MSVSNDIDGMMVETKQNVTEVNYKNDIPKNSEKEITQYPMTNSRISDGYDIADAVNEKLLGLSSRAASDTDPDHDIKTRSVAADIDPNYDIKGTTMGRSVPPSDIVSRSVPPSDIDPGYTKEITTYPMIITNDRHIHEGMNEKEFR